MDLGLKGKKAIITGATKGIGRAVAELFVEEGVSVGFCARNPLEVAATAGVLNRPGLNIVGEALDVRDIKRYIDWLNRTVICLGGCDIFVPNVSAIEGTNPDNWSANFEVDAMHTVRGCETLLSSLADSDAGSVVIIASTNALESRWEPTSYGAIKAALITYAKQLSQHVAGRGIRVNSVSPGPILYEGGIWEGIRNQRRQFFDETLRHFPNGRMGDPCEVARIVVFIASPAASLLLGSNIVADNGFTKHVQF